MKRILCLSGGGVRGVSQLQVLVKLEELHGPLHEYYDLITGSSVGAINAAIIATGKISMKELDTQYDAMIDKIFEPRGFFKKPKYDRNNFAIEWEKLVGTGIKYGDAKTKLMTTTVDLVSDTNIFYKSWHEDDATEDMMDLVMRSFAAPLYFGQIVDYVKELVYSDGGVGNANLPIDDAKLQAEAFFWYGYGAEVEIHAIGTLFDDKNESFKKVARGRWLKQLASYMNPLEGGLARAQSREDQLRKMKFICSNVESISFKYWDTTCPQKYLKLDGLKYMNKYRNLGLKMAEKPLISFN